MSEGNEYRAVYTDKLAEGVVPEDVHQRLAILLKTDINSLEKGFGSRRALIKKGLDEQTARSSAEAPQKELSK